MNTYKLTVEYDGTKYKGWQRLKNSDKTIQYRIEILLSKLLDEAIEIHGAGRTDASVHALEQVAHFKTNKDIEEESFIDICNEMLPQDIIIKKIDKVNPEFHARFSAKSKYYTYRIWNDKIPSAFRRKYFHQVKEKLDIEAMNKAASYFIGEHNFQAFTADKSKKSKIRTIYSIEITKNGNEIEIVYHGNGFLYKMVRIMTGTLIEVGLNKRSVEQMTQLLEDGERKLVGETAPGYGLYLTKVMY